MYLFLNLLLGALLIALPTAVTVALVRMDRTVGTRRINDEAAVIRPVEWDRAA